MNKQLTAIVLSRYFCTNKFHFAYYSDSVGVTTNFSQICLYQPLIFRLQR